jgi:hypothetical protein
LRGWTIEPSHVACLQSCCTATFEVTVITNDIDKLQKEHADFAKLLGLLEAQIELFHHGEQSDYDLMLDILYYMTP